MLKVSIITVCLNSEKTIRDTLESVLSQSYPLIQYVVIDGGSTDLTLSIINEYKERIEIIISEKDRGIYDAMNKGISVATGEIIGMLNSDDVYINKFAIEDLVNKMASENTDSVFADLIIVDKYCTNRALRYYDSSYFSPNKFRFGWMPAHPTFFVKKFLYDRVGKYSLNYQISSDYEMLIRLLWTERISYSYLAKPVVRMRSGGISTSGIKRSIILNREIVIACRNNKIYTNIFLVSLKFPIKLMGFLQAKFFNFKNNFKT